MLRTAGLLAFPRKALSAGFAGGISPPFQFVAAQLLGGWDLTETGLAPASPLELIWTHLKRGTPAKLVHPLCWRTVWIGTRIGMRSGSACPNAWRPDIGPLRQPLRHVAKNHEGAGRDGDRSGRLT